MPRRSRKLLVKHRTEFVYAGFASESVNEVRLGPVDAQGQRVERARLEVDPQTDVAQWFDGFGNRVWWFQVVEPHERLVIEAESVVQTGGLVPIETPETPGQWAIVDSPAYRQEWADFVLPSSLVTWSDQTRRFGEGLGVGTPGGVAAWAEELAAALNEALVYERGVTDTSTTVDGAIDAGRGVCQDFAHIFVALCRMRGVAAKYVSGWLFEPDREGPVESHAWASVQVPGIGWFDVDPTHPGEVGGRHVRVAAGRDYADVMPVRGTYLGSPTESMTVEVELRHLDVPAAI